MNDVVEITKYTHYFKIRNVTPRIRKLIYEFSKGFTEFGEQYDRVTRRKSWVPVKTYGICAGRGAEYRFHIGQYPLFMDLLNREYVHPSEYKVETVEFEKPEKIDLRVKPGWDLYPEQIEACEFAVSGGLDRDHNVLLAMPTGSGKTVTSLMAAAKLGYRLSIHVLAMYVDKWIGDCMDILEIERDEICVVQGGDILQRVTNYPGSGLPTPKIFIVSHTTMNLWYKQYEEDPSNPILDSYSCLPEDFCRHLGIGVQIFDEAHQHPYAVYRSHLYTHGVKTISLSATLLTTNQVVRKIQSIMFPHFKRFEKIKMKRYITCHACNYQILNYRDSKIRTEEWGQTSYSHVAFEKSVMANKKILREYLEMIHDRALTWHFEKKTAKDKLLIFVATKKMAALVRNYFKTKHPNTDIRTYLQENDYKDVLEPEICVSTLTSAGTAIDIKNLRNVIMTTSINSPNANAQALGRLRELKDRLENNDVHFHYFYCSTIKKHVEYHVAKKMIFAERVIAYLDEYIGAINR